MDRRKFFGVAAATGVAAVVPTRAFVRTLEDRPEKIEGEVLPSGASTNVITRLYSYGELVHTQADELSTLTRKNVMYVGVGQSVQMRDWEGRVDKCTMALESLPEIELDLPFEGFYYTAQGDTLTFQADSVSGFVKVG